MKPTIGGNHTCLNPPVSNHFNCAQKRTIWRFKWATGTKQKWRTRSRHCTADTPGCQAAHASSRSSSSRSWTDWEPGSCWLNIAAPSLEAWRPRPKTVAVDRPNHWSWNLWTLTISSISILNLTHSRFLVLMRCFLHYASFETSWEYFWLLL